jgi:hypothetical protein
VPTVGKPTGPTVKEEEKATTSLLSLAQCPVQTSTKHTQKSRIFFQVVVPQHHFYLPDSAGRAVKA